jgi:hypothetical protein
MKTLAMPDTVIQVLGPAAARDLQNWLETQLHSVEETSALPISALVARRKVNVLMLERVSNLLLAGEPALERVPDGDLVWRVPVYLTFPSTGIAGAVGIVRADAQRGNLLVDEKLLNDIAAACERLAGQPN